MLRILIRNILSNWVGFAVQATVVFFLTPFIVHSLGDARYGIWALVTSFTGYYGLLDLGFRSGITQYLTRHLAKKDFDQLSRTGSTAFVVLACCGSVIALLALVITWIAPYLFDIPLDAITEARWCIFVIGVTTGLQFPFFLYSSVFAATQRYDLATVVSIAVRLGTAAATVVALTHGYGLVALCMVNGVGMLLGCLARWRVARRILPQLRISAGMTNWASLRSIAHFGLWSFVIRNSTTLTISTGGIIISVFMPISALTPYVLALGLVEYFNRAFQPMAAVFFPAATQLDAQGDTARLKKMYLSGSKILILSAMAAAMIGVFWAEDFFRLWVGERFVDGVQYPSVALLFAVLIASAFVTTAQRIGNQVLQGRRKQRHLACAAGAEATANVVLGVLLVQAYGLVGVALAGLVSAILFQGIARPMIVCWVMGISGTYYVSHVWARPLACGIVLACVLILVRHLAAPITSWGVLALIGLIAGLAAAVLLVRVGLNDQERDRLLLKPAHRFLRRLRVTSTAHDLSDSKQQEK